VRYLQGAIKNSEEVQLNIHHSFVFGKLKGYVIYKPGYTYKFQLKITNAQIQKLFRLLITFNNSKFVENLSNSNIGILQCK
jgi:hypothetical protein